MAISDDLNSIRTHLEDDYTALETLGVSVQDRNIENIKDMANQIYAKFPKTSYAEGSNITLSNTLKGKLDFENDIVGYGQTNQESTNGYQLLNYTLETLKALNTSGTWNNNIYTLNGLTFTVNEDLTITVNGTSTADATFNIQNFSYTNGNEYTLIDELDDNVYRKYVMMVASFSQWGQNTLITDKYVTFTASATANISTRIVVYNNNTLSNKIFKPMLYSGAYDSSKTFEKYTGGQASPNPSYPQDIEVVRGKNLAQLEFENGYRNSGSGEIISTGSFCSFIAEVSPNNEYYASNAHSNLCYLDINKNRIGGIAFSGGGLFNTNNMPNIAYVSVAVENSKKDSIQIEKGSQATSYLPYNTLEVVERGINDFDISQVEIGKAWNNASASNRAVCYFNASEGDIFTISATGISVFDQSTIRVIFKANRESTSNLGIYDITTSRTFTAPVGAGIACIQFNKDNISLSDFEGVEIMINEGDTALPYEPYQTPQTYQLSLGEYEFAKIGNYVDTIEYDVDEDKVYKNENVLKIYGGALNWSRFVIQIGGQNANLLRSESVTNLLKNSEGKSNFYTCLTQGTRTNPCFYINVDNPYIDVVDNNYETGESFKSYCSTNNIVFYAPALIPTKKEITGTLADQIKALYNSHSFTGTTIIEIDGQLPLIIKVRALKG